MKTYKYQMHRQYREYKLFIFEGLNNYINIKLDKMKDW